MVKKQAEIPKKQGVVAKLREKRDNLMSRREHRSFRMTKRRDYSAPMPLPGYWSFSLRVLRLIRKNKKFFLLLAAIFVVLSWLLVGLFSQETFTYLSEELGNLSGDVASGDLGQVGQASVLLLTIVTGGISGQLSEVQQVYAALIGILLWLAVVWSLRSFIAGKTVKVRDALYNSGAPLISTLLVSMIMLAQLIPIAIILIALSAQDIIYIYHFAVCRKYL